MAMTTSEHRSVHPRQSADGLSPGFEQWRTTTRYPVVGEHVMRYERKGDDGRPGKGKGSVQPRFRQALVYRTRFDQRLVLKAEMRKRKMALAGG